MLTLPQELKHHKETFEELMQNIQMAKAYFQASSPVKFAMYNGNCCRQAAYITKKFLESKIPSYTWVVYQGSFYSTKHNSAYEHAWCYGTRKGDKGVLVDFAFDSSIMNNYLLVTDDNRIPDDNEIENLDNRVTLSDCYFEQPEFFTGLEGKELIKELNAFGTLFTKEQRENLFTFQEV